MRIYFRSFFGPENLLVTLKLIRYSLLMLLFPVGTFYFFFHVIFNGDRTMLGWSGIAAVFAANAVIVAYVIMAWNEDIPSARNPRKPALKRDVRVD